MKTSIFNVDIDCFSKREFEKKLDDALLGDKAIKIGKVNTEFLLRAKDSKEFSDTLNNFDINIADGSGVLWAAKYLSLPMTKIPGLRFIQAWWQAKYSLLMLAFNPKYCAEPIPERFPGVEAFYMMLESAERTKASVFLFGGEEEVLKKTIVSIMVKLPNLVICGSHNGYGFIDEDVIADINKKKPKLLVVALGSPKQEYWIRDNIASLPSVRIAVGEGGSFDFVAGVHKRAPKWMRQAGLEWFWRLFMNRDKTGGSRAKRVWRAVPVFVREVVKWKLNHEEK